MLLSLVYWLETHPQRVIYSAVALIVLFGLFQ